MGCGSSSSADGARDNSSGENTKKTVTQSKEEPVTKQTPQVAKTTGNQSDTTNQFLNDAVKSHNAYRAKHSAGPLVASSELQEYSQNYANKLAAADQMKHSDCTLPSGGRVGENLYCYWSSDTTAMPTAEDAVKSWYDEIKDYDFNNGGFSMGTGHFTQVVWKGSKELGMAWAKSSKGTTYVVANYRPAGNMMGDFDNNVTSS